MSYSVCSSTITRQWENLGRSTLLLWPGTCRGVGSAARPELWTSPTLDFSAAHTAGEQSYALFPPLLWHDHSLGVRSGPLLAGFALCCISFSVHALRLLLCRSLAWTEVVGPALHLPWHVVGIPAELLVLAVSSFFTAAWRPRPCGFFRLPLWYFTFQRCASLHGILGDMYEFGV